MASSTMPCLPISRRDPTPSEPPSRSSRRAKGRSAANVATEMPTNPAHSPARPTSAKARAEATTAPMANGARKKAPGVAISPIPNSTAAPSQIQRHCSGSSMGRQATDPGIDGIDGPRRAAPRSTRSTADRNRGQRLDILAGWRLIRSASCPSTPTPTTSRPRERAPWPSTTPRASTRCSCAAPAARRATSSTRPWTCPRSRPTSRPSARPSSTRRRPSSATTRSSCSATATRACPTARPTPTRPASPRPPSTRRSAAWSRSSAAPVRRSIITYGDEQGGYPHPDHLRVHEITQPAVERAADPDWYPEAGEPWQVSKIYYSVWSKKRIELTHAKYLELEHRVAVQRGVVRAPVAGRPHHHGDRHRGLRRGPLRRAAGPRHPDRPELAVLVRPAPRGVRRDPPVRRLHPGAQPGRRADPGGRPVRRAARRGQRLAWPRSRTSARRGSTCTPRASGRPARATRRHRPHRAARRHRHARRRGPLRPGHRRRPRSRTSRSATTRPPSVTLTQTYADARADRRGASSTPTPRSCRAASRSSATWAR